MGKKGLPKSLRTYLSKLKKVPAHLHIPNSPHPATATSWLLSACKYPKTPSFAADRDHPDDDGGHGHEHRHDHGLDLAATLSDVDRFLHENFNSIYPREDDGDEFSSSEPPARYDEDPPPTAFRSSEPFFVSSGTSNSLLDEARASATSSSFSSSPSVSCSFQESSDAGAEVPGGGVAVMTFSKDPYDDFRRSMQDMVEARHVDPNQPLDWDFMEELLFCYLDLNDHSVHKYILRAFTELTVSFRRRVMVQRRRAPSGDNVTSRRMMMSRRPADAAGDGCLVVTHTNGKHSPGKDHFVPLNTILELESRLRQILS
ncbi:unnamed protein product [Musa hybrid cultivar]